MAETKRKVAAKAVNDVQKASKAPTESTAEPVIVTHRQILRDPMVTTEAITPAAAKSAPALPKDVAEPDAAPDAEVVPAEPAKDDAAVEPKAALATSKKEIVIAPLSSPEDESVGDEKPAEDQAETPADSEPEPKTDSKEVSKEEPAASEKQETDVLKSDTNPEAIEAAAEEAEIKRQAELQKIADSKKYYLPINAIEQKRVQQFIALGVVFSILLGLAWLDIALDAGLLHLQSIHPVTHFFSN